jgi:hypothetical protein
MRSTGCTDGCECPHVRPHPEVLAAAKSQRWDPAEVLRVLLDEEAAGRDRATIRMRRRASGLPAGKKVCSVGLGTSSRGATNEFAPSAALNLAGGARA